MSKDSLKYAIYSCEGFAREVLPSLRAQVGFDADFVFVDDDPEKANTKVYGFPVVTFDELRAPEHRDRLVSIAIADSQVREKLVKRCAENGFRFTSIVDLSHLRNVARRPISLYI